MAKPKRESDATGKRKANKRTRETESSKDETSKRRKSDRSKSAKSSTRRTNVKNTEKKVINQIFHPSTIGIPLVIGQGEMGQLGLGEDVSQRNKPTTVPLKEQVVQVCAGGLLTVLLTETGKVYTFGCNDEGALGRIGDEFEPGQVDLPDKIVHISAGDCHAAALTENGRVYAWGEFRDSKGSMGLTSDGQKKTKPYLLISDVPIAKIASGNNHLVCLSQDGVIYTCGCGEQGQLGRIAECFSERGGRKGPDLVLSPAPVHVRKIKGQNIIFDDIWAGPFDTFAKQKDTGHIYTFGLNNYCQLGILDNLKISVPTLVESMLNNKWIDIACGVHHTIALSSEGKVYAFGRKEYGRLGLGPDCDDAKQPTLIPTLSNKKCVCVSCGENLSYAVTENGKLYAWGMGSTNQLGNKDESDIWEPQEITGNQLMNRKVQNVSGGGQHTVILANM